MKEKIIVATLEEQEIFPSSRCIYLKSNNFRYIVDKNGNKHKHPEWIDNYIKAIKLIRNEISDIEEYSDIEFVVIDVCEIKVIEELMDNKLSFLFIKPETIYGDPFKFKEIYMRYEEILRTIPHNIVISEKRLYGYMNKDINPYNYLKSKIKATPMFKKWDRC